MSDRDPIRWAEGGGPPGGAELVRELRPPPPLPPDLRILSHARHPAPPRAPRWIGPTLATAVVLGGLVLWVLRPAPRAPDGADPFVALVRAPDDAAGADAVRATAPSEPPAPIAGGTRPAITGPSDARPATAPEAHARRGRRLARSEPVDLPPGDETRAAGEARATGGVGTLRINTRPWTQVYVDGRLVGLTPQMRIVLAAGRHTVELVNAEARIRHRINVEIRAGQTETRVLSLTPGSAEPAREGAVGYLVIQSLPWARVWLDGEDTGRNTPVRSMRVSAGRHTITLVTGDGARHDVVVDVPPDETVRIVRQL